MNTIKAVVHKVIRDGTHGPFAVATSEGIDGSVTFSLDPSVWKEKEWPESGMVVSLGKLRKKRAGWRAKEVRFWKPSDEQSQQQAKSNGVQFLYPMAMQFPFDAVCQQIVLELEKRNWEVPGIAVEFYEYGTGEDKYRMVSNIRGADFGLHFCRGQHTLAGGRLNDIAGVNELTIPKKQLHVYEDESGPTFYLYVGDDWERDKERFVRGSKVNSKLGGEPKTYLEYSGSASRSGGYTYAGRRSAFLVHTNDLGREYDPEGNEPKLFSTKDVMEEFRLFFDSIAANIVALPIPKVKTDRFAPKPVHAFPASVGPIFCFGEYDDAKRIIQGKKDPAELEPADRYGMIGNGYRLVSLNVRNTKGFPEVAYDGFLWCGVGEPKGDTPIDSLEVPGHTRWSDRERFIIRLAPNRAEDIYIADHAAWEKRRKELADAIKDARDKFTSEEIADFIGARAATLVPVTEYQGGYEQPIVLIRRELSFDEVEVVSGPHKDHFGR